VQSFHLEHSQLRGRMTEREKLIRDIDTLIDSLREDWKDLATKNMTPEERADTKQHIQWLVQELEELLRKLDT
jgi:hypothetical protein